MMKNQHLNMLQQQPSGDGWFFLVIGLVIVLLILRNLLY